MANRSVELAVEPVSADVCLRFGRVETGRYYRLSRLLPSVAPPAWVLRLRDSAGLIQWEPDGVEEPLAGRVFAAVLKQLYDGRRWRMNLAVNSSQMGCGPMIAHVRQLVADVEDREREGLFEHMSVHGLSHGFEVSMPNPDPDYPDEPYVMDYWWCPKPALGPVLAESWSYRSTGYVAPWPDRGALKTCFRPQSLRGMLARLLCTCKLMFQGAGSGESMILVSHHVTPEQVKKAAQRPLVLRALRTLNRKALLIEWVERREEIGGIIYRVREKPREGAPVTG